MSSQRLQKLLAQAGIASRRAAEHLITEGRVRVNGRVVSELGARANPQRDRVEVDGKRIVAQRHVYFLLHKPRGFVTTLDDPEGRKTIKDLLRDINERVYPVGRLDFQTSGALLLTNDGELTQALLHPTRAVPKVYNAKLQGKLEEPRLNLLRAGVVLDDGQQTAPAEVKILRAEPKFTSIEITISEGKNRQIHRMAEAVGRTVVRLTRLSFAGLTLEGLRAGQLRPLSPPELADLKEIYLHRPKRRHPMHGYNRTELGAAPALFATEEPGSDNEQAAARPTPGRGSARRPPGRRGPPRKGASRTKPEAQPRKAHGSRTKAEAQPRKAHGSRTQNTKGARARPTKTTKRASTPRTKTRFKR